MHDKALSIKVRHGLLWSLISSWGNKLLTLVLFMVLARVLNQHDLGVFAAALVVFNFLALFVDQGLGDAIVYKAEVSEHQLNTIFMINLALAMLIFAGLWFGAPMLAGSMKMVELVDVVRVGGLCILIGALCVSQQAMHRRNFNYRWLAVCMFAATVIGGAIAIFCAFQGYGAWALVAQALVSALVTASMLWIKSQWSLSLSFDFRGVRSMLSYGMNRLGSNVLDFVNTRYIEIFLAAVLGPVMLGIYSVGVRIFQALMQALSSAILDVAHNGFSRLANDRPGLVSAYYQSITISAAVMMPIFIFLAAMSPEVIPLLFGEKWIASASVLRPMAILGAVQVLQFYNGTVYSAIGKPSIGLKFLIVKTSLTLSALYLAREQSMIAIVYVFVFCQLITVFPSFYLAKRLIGVSLLEVWRRVSPFILACLLAVGGTFLMAYAFGAYEWALLVRTIAMGAGYLIIYTLASYTAAPILTRNVIEILRSRKQ